MTKRIVFAVIQFVCFCALFYVGGYWAEVRLGLELRALQKGAAPPPMIPLWKLHINPSLDYIANGVVFALVFFLLILLVQGLRRKFWPAAGFTTVALMLAFGLSLIMKSGFVPLSNF